MSERFGLGSVNEFAHSFSHDRAGASPPQPNDRRPTGQGLDGRNSKVFEGRIDKYARARHEINEARVIDTAGEGDFRTAPERLEAGALRSVTYDHKRHVRSGGSLDCEIEPLVRHKLAHG
jgi:hypothetical protein